MTFDAGIAIISSSSGRREFFKSVIEAADHVTFQAADRAHGMNLLERHRISVVICDFQLPDGDWRDFLSATATMAEPPRVIVVAPSCSRQRWEEILELGGSEVIMEPLHAGEIRRAVDLAAQTWTGRLAPVSRKAATAAASATGSSTPCDTMNSKRPGEMTGNPAILVIDDDPRIRQMLKTLLHAAGYDVLLAATGLEGIELFRENADRVSLILLDCEMPGMNGAQVFDRLVAIRRDVKVVVASGQSPSEIVHRFTGRGIADFLPKPFTPKDLNETIRAALAA